MREVALVIDKNGKSIYSRCSFSPTSVEDSNLFWEFIWQNRDKIDGIAHSHPGRGAPIPSSTDLTTFRAIEKALGRHLRWFIISEDEVTEVYVDQIEPDTYSSRWLHKAPGTWVDELRTLSNY